MRTALIVEDEPQANKLLALLVGLRGYATESAFSGSEALEKVRDRVPDVVFLDLMLPDLDGYQVCRKLKSSGMTSQVPVVIVTARIAAENRIQSFRAGADDYVPKPYTPDQIFEALDQSNEYHQPKAAWPVEGDVVLDGRDDGQTLRRLARLRAQLLAQCALEPPGVDSICAAIGAIWSDADAWSRRCDREQVASLTYELTSKSLILTVHDEAGWLSKDGDREGPLGISRLTDAGFDRVENDQQAHCLRLVKVLGSP
jgi:CheY-like chemotaxis protein